MPAFALLLVLANLGRPLPVYAAVDFTVDSTTDTAASPANSQTCNSPCSLRAALQAADNRAIAGTLTTTISVNAGTYNLDPTLGALQVGAVSGQVLNLTAGGAVTINQVSGCTETATLSCMVLFLDPNSVGNFTASIDGFTIQGGHTAIGGGGIAGGSISTAGTTPGDNTTISNSTIRNNSATGGVPGGGIGYFHGNLTITNSTITNNTSNTGSGGGIDYTDIDPSAGTLTISNSTISLNTTTQNLGGGGGGLHILGTNASVVISGSTFDQNSASSSVSPGGGGAIDKESGSLTVHNSTFTSNAAGALGSGGAINSESGATNLGDGVTPGLNRFAFNTAGASGTAFYKNTANAATVTAENDWWATNNPAAGAVSGISPTAYFVLSLSASPSAIQRNATSTLTGDLTHNNLGGTPGLLPNESAIPVTWPNPTPGLGTLSNKTATLSTTPGTATATYTAGSTPGDDTAHVQVDGFTANTTIEVIAPPGIAKAFGAASIPLNGTTSLTFTLTNGNQLTDLTGVAFSDTLPPGLVVATPNGLTSTCGGITTATAGGISISLSGGTITHNSSCTISVNVTGVAAGTQNNTTGNVSATESGTGGTASASIVVEAPPSIAKVFNPSTIALNATTSLTFTITNPASNPNALTGVAFTDTLPTGLTVASSTSTVCGGTLTTTAPTSISLSGATINTSAQCQFSVTVTGAASGDYTNITGNVSSTNGGTGNTASANLTVAAPPQVAKSFGAPSIPLGSTTSMDIQIQNPNSTVTLTGVSFTDSLPAGLVVATPANLSNNCGGTATATGGSGQVSLSGGVVAAGVTCTVSVEVQGTTAGTKNNSVQASSTEGGTGNTSNASIVVAGPPSISKAFGAASIALNGSTSLSFTISNPNPVALTGVGFSDTLPAGLVVSTPNGLTGSCGGGTITATAGTSSISLSGATLAASSSCTFSVNVTGTAAGTQTNTTGSVTSTEGGSGGTASASIDVEAPPDIAKVFNPSTIAVNATTSLTFTITNPAANPDPLTGVAFTDTLPTGLTVANATATVCGGTLTTTAPGTISLVGATIGTNSQCQFSVTVTGVAGGSYVNTTGSVTSTNGGTGNSASASLQVASPPSISKAFGAPSIPLNGTTSLGFTISNPNTGVTLTGIGFSDSFPAGLQVASPSNLSNTCGGTATAAAGAAAASLSGGSLAPGAGCTVSLDVQGTTAGTKNNSVQVSSNEGGTGNTSNASVVVVGPPSISKAFGAGSVVLGSSTSLSFTINNPNSGTALTGVGFTDTLPAGLVVATPNGLTGVCGGGTVTATAGSGSVSLSGATLLPSAGCTFSVNVTPTSAGTKNNSTGPVSSNEGGSGAAGTASLTVQQPTISTPTSSANPAVEGSTSVTYTTTVGPTPPSGTVTFFDGGTAISGCSNVVPNSSGVATCNAGVYPTAGTHAITATYSQGPVTSGTLSEVVNDAPLSASPGSNLSGTEGQAIPDSVVATFSDANPNGVAGDFTADIDWGDGTTSAGTVSNRLGGGFQVSGGHTYADAGTYSVTVTITDTKGGATATASLSATIADVPLQLTANPSMTATAGQPFNGVVATFVDPTGKEPVAEYAATIDWGDGSQSAGTITDPPGSFSISGSHTYAAAGTFTVTVTAREVDPSASAAVSAAGTMTVAGAAAPNTTAPGRPQPLLLFAALAALLLLAGVGGFLWARRRTTGLR